MKRTTKTAWMAALAAWVLATQAFASMIGIGREGDWALEIFAERSEVVRSAGGAKVTLPSEAEGMFRAADVRTGDGVWSGAADGAGKADASVVRLVPGWWSCELELKEAVRPAPQPVERFHLLRWTDLGGRFAVRLDGLARTNEAAWRNGMDAILEQMRTVFGGQSMVVGFPGTKYAAEFAALRRAFDRCARKGQMRGFAAGRDLQAAYRDLFAADWPTALQAVFLCGDARPLEIRRIAGADGKPLPDVFESPLPVRLDGTNRVEGVFPADSRLQIAYAPAADGDAAGEGEERVFPWPVSASGGRPAWFVLQAASGEEGGGLGLTTNLLENAGSVAVAVKVMVGDETRTATLPTGGTVLLCLVVRPGTPIHLNGEPAESDPYARDWTVSGQQAAEAHVRFDSVRKEQPGIVLNNPEMMPVDVTVTPAGGGWGSATKLTLQAGETGIGIPVPAHKALAVAYRFRSSFHKAGHTDIPPLFYGDRSNLVLRAELKGDPEVVLQNTGPVAVRVAGMASPADGVTILPGKTATVTVPAGRRTLLTGTAAHADYQCEPVSLSAMDPGESTSAKLHATLKPAPQIVLRNIGGMMDAEATLMSGAGRPLGKPFTVKRGDSTRPMPMPPTPTAYYRLNYSNGRFTAQGRLDIPAVPRGEVRTLDIPNPTEGIRLQTPGMPASAAPARPVSPPSARDPVPAPASAVSVPAAPSVPGPAPTSTAAPVPAASPATISITANPVALPAAIPNTAPAPAPAEPPPPSSASAPVLLVP
ncbi:MAG: hypothetical protein IKQ15_06760 [Kiritimatiellae bacterium]|nr:hypothetical protein [Kiritimatiellia bacterium]